MPSRWPVIVERLDPATATAVYCAACGWTGEQDDPGNGPAEDVMPCEGCGLMTLDYCYEEGQRCGSCRKLAVDHPLADDRGRYCSRAHQLQAEYARSLP